MRSAAVATGFAADTIASRPGEEIDTVALGAFLHATIPDFASGAPTLSVRQFPSGFSNLTYFVQARTDACTHAFVLRRPPVGVTQGIAHNVCREHDVLVVLHSCGVPVPRPLAKCEDVGILGAPFYLMEFVDGEILRGPSMPTAISGARTHAAAAGTMGTLSQLCIDALVHVHATDVESTPMVDWRREGSYIERQIAGWTKRWHAAATDDVHALRDVAQWLAAHRPPDRYLSLVHNDFKFDNLVLARDLSQVRAILDWEMATVGDPLMDLGTTLAYWIEAGDDQVFRSLGLGVTALPGTFTRADVAAAYAASSGRDVSDVVFYYVFGLFKVAVIAQQIYARHLSGTTRDPRFAGLGVVVDALGRAAVHTVETQML